jgi:hypothetical protein
MADNIELPSGSGGAIVATDDVSGAHYQLVKLAFGALNAATLVEASAGLPVNVVNASLAITAAALPLPSGAATAAKQPAPGTAGTASADVLTVQGIASMTPLLVADGGGSLTVDGPLTDAELRATPVPVSGTVNAAQNGSWTVTAQQGGSWAVTVSDGGGSITVDGTVAIFGTVAVTDNSSSLTVDNNGTFATQATLQAGTALVGKVSQAPDTSTVYNGTTALTPKFAAISASNSGDNTVVAAVTSKKIRVLRWRLSANGDVNAKWKSATAGDITGLSYLTQYASAGGAYCPVGLFETTSGEALVLNLSGAVAVGGELTYLEV